MTRTGCTLITGASSGIGRAVALRLSSGKALVLHGRDAARLDEVKRECGSLHQHVIWRCDFRDTAAVGTMLTDLIERRNLAIEGIVHCAGMLTITPLRLVENGDADEVMRVNFMSAVEIVRLLVRKKVNATYLKSVVFLSSTASQFGARGFQLYCASKGALDAFMRAIAVELAPGVRANSVLPGAIRTPMTERMLEDSDIAARLAAEYPLGIGAETDVVNAIEFLLSDAARWITGQQLVVDGGRTINITA